MTTSKNMCQRCSLLHSAETVLCTCLCHSEKEPGEAEQMAEAQQDVDDAMQAIRDNAKLSSHGPIYQPTPVSDWEKTWNMAETEQCVRANIERPENGSTERAINNILAHIATKLRIVLHSHTEQLVEQERHQIAEELEKRKKTIGHIHGCNMCSPKCGYNQAIDDAIEVVLKKE